jgi:hypothetical protein
MTTAWGEADQIRVPMPDGTYRDYSMLGLLGANHGQLQGAQGFGMPPIRIIEQRGPLQHGATTIDYRYDDRVLQVVISERLACQLDMVDRRWWLHDLLRPSRSFIPGACPAPLVYRKWLPGGKAIRGTDLVLTTGSDVVTSITGRFVHYGLRAGSRFTIQGSIADDGDYTVVNVNHDGSLQISGAMTNDETGIHWVYTSEPSVRDLYCILELGPAFDREDRAPNGYIEALRFLATDPFWYGAEQQQEWSIAVTLDNLRFDYGDAGVGVDAEGAWFGATGGAGLWLFGNNYVSGTIDVPYWGHHNALPLIVIEGPVQGLTFTNQDTDATIFFDYAVSPGRTVELDTQNLTAYDDLGNDLYLYLTGDLSGLLLTPDAANDRVNSLFVSYGGATEDSQVTIAWRNRYLSV